MVAGRNRQEGAGRSQESQKTGHQNRGTCGTRRERNSAAHEERSASTTKAQMKRMYGCGPGTSDQPQDKSSGGLTGRRIRRERRSAAQEERRASGKEHQRTCTTAHLCRRRRRKQHEGQDPKQHVLAAGWSFPYKTDGNCWKIVGNLKALI